MNKEIRMLNIEFRTVENEEGKMIIEGYPITFNCAATHFGLTEVIDPSALNETDMSDVPLKYNHNDGHLLLARTRNGSLKFEIDSIGLKMRAELIDTQSNRDIYKCIQSNLLDKMSFAFTTKEDKYDFENNTRTILNIDKLYDVSVVDLPFYDSTSVYARDIDTSKEDARKFLLNKVNNSLKKELLNRL